MSDDLEPSCPTHDYIDRNKRTEFGTLGATAYGYPSSGGVLIKEVDLVDMLFLQLDRFNAAQRSENTLEEDKFCALMRKIGASWWADEQEWVEVQLGMRVRTALESRQLVFGWPTNGEGVWVLRYNNERQIPQDFGKISLAMNMDERCEVIKSYGATFYADPETMTEVTREL